MSVSPRSIRILALVVLVASTGTLFAEEQKTKSAKAKPAAPKSDLIKAAEAAEARRKAVAAGLVDKDAPTRDTPSPLAKAAAAAKSSKATRDESAEFTTADLERMFGGSTEGVFQGGDSAAQPSDGAAPADDGTAPSGPAARAGDPLALMQMQQAQQEQQREQTAAAQAEVQRIEARIQDLERRKIAISNPLLARPQGAADEEGNEDWKDLDNRQRIERTDAQLAELRKQLADARQKAGGS